MHVHTSRKIENLIALAGFSFGLLYIALVEILPHVVYSLGRCESAPAGRGFPWGVVVIICVSVLPKTVSRASAGKVWESMAGRFGGRA